MRKFRGFNPNQMQTIHQRLGYNGQPDGFQGYLSKNPDKASKFSQWNDKARGMISPNSAGTASSGPVAAQGKAPPDNQLMVQNGQVVTPQVQQTSAPATPQQDMQVQAPQQPLAIPSINTPNPGMPVWSGLPEGTPLLSDVSKYEPQQSPIADVQYMAEGGDVKKRERDNPQGAQNRRAKNFREKDKPKDDKPNNNDKPEKKDKPFGNASLLTERAIKDPEKLITKTETEILKPKDKQFIDKDGKIIDPATVDKTATANYTKADAPKKTKAHTVKASKSGDQVDEVLDDTEAAQGTVSDQAQVEAAQALPSSNATVQGQLEKLMTQFEGGQTPAWAAGAMRMANTAMAARGLGSSSMAGAAITQAAMESAINIAVTDAATFSQFEMQNLNNRQQARLQNAQAFLQMDMANLNNRQQTEIFKSQARIQSLFTDQAAENATRQFNATSQNQTDQFFANLKTQVETFNSAQKNAISMFNSEQKNATKQFNITQKNMAKQFNAQNRLVIDQANAQWRQQIATTNNANINENNRINAQAATGLTMAGFNNLWQTERDLMAYAFTAAENMSQRAHEVVLAKMGVDLQEDLADQESKNALWEVGGQFVASIFDGIF